MTIVWFCWRELDFIQQSKTVSLSFRAKRSEAWNLSNLKKNRPRFLRNDKHKSKIIEYFNQKGEDETLPIYPILSFL